MDVERPLSDRKTGLKPGTKLSIIIPELQAKESDFSLSTKFEEDLEDNRFMMGAPFLNSALFPLQGGTMVHLSYFSGKLRFDFQGVVRDRLKRDGMYYIIVERTTSILRTQRRQDFRLDLSADAKLQWDERDETGAPHRQVIPGKTVDVSGGGVGMRVNRSLAGQPKVLLSIQFPDKEAAEYLSEPRWVISRDTDSDYRYMCGLRFLHENSQDKEQLVRRIFRIQQKRLRTDPNWPSKPKDSV